MNFSEALEELKKGNAISRKIWIKDDMYIFLIGTDMSEEGIGGWTFTNGVNDNKTIQSFIAIRTNDWNVYPWNPSSIDLLSEDWVVVNKT